MARKNGSYASSMKGGRGLQRIIKALGYSVDGVCFAWQEQGFRQLFWIHGTLILCLLLADFSVGIKMVLLLGSFMSIVIELLNTGIEAAVDHASEDRSELAKKAKDVGSAAQYITLAMLAILWIMAMSGK